jgi:phosphoheptose isomerase
VLKTEERNPRTMYLDSMTAAEMLAVMQDENEHAAAAIRAELPAITAAVEAIVPRMQAGGRLIYVGCGTSGRLGVLDAAECPPTYGVPHGLVIGLIAGGDGALRRAAEGAEDSFESGVHDLAALTPTEKDTVVGISVAGGAAYVLGAFAAAERAGALCIALTIGVNHKLFGIDSELHFNSQAAVFGQSVREMNRLLELQGGATLENISVGYGDLYVTVYGGRTRLVGILLGRGLNIDEAKAELKGVTLESLVVAERVARAIRIKAERGETEISQFPLLMHVDEIIVGGKEVNIPWDSFTYEK